MLKQLAANASLFLCVLTLAFDSNSVCAQTNVTGLNTKYEYLLDAMQAGRMQIESGEFVASGRYKNFEDSLHPVDGNVTINCGFDFPKAQVRCDRVFPVWVRNGKSGYQKTQYARTATALTTRSSNNEIVSVLPTSRKNPSWAKPLDVRVLGLVFFGDLQRGSPFEEIWRTYVDALPKSIDEEEEVYTLKWDLTEEISRTLVIDGASGFWPIRMELMRVGENEPFMESDLTLRKRKGIYLPKSFRIRERNRELSMKMRWDAVNDSIDESRFSYASFDLSGVRLVVDSRLGKKVILERHAGESTVHEPMKLTAVAWLCGIVAVALLIGTAAITLFKANRRRFAY